ncbi:MAG: DUF402 domain-containing protein [Chloroflexota bacterium]
MMIVIKNDHKSKELWRYPVETILNRSDCHITIEAFFNRDDYDAGFTVFKRDDRFVETFYNDRWYNVFAIYDRDDGGLKGWYCNITRPAQWDDEKLASDDIALDVWVPSDESKKPIVLDQEEFVELGLPPAESAEALKAVDQILELAKANLLPK